MPNITQRDISITDRIARAEKDLLDLKGSQFFGRDVTTPKIIQRHNSDGSPTTTDVIGLQESSFGVNTYTARGYVTFKARNQSNPWGTVYVEASVIPTGGVPSATAVTIEVFVDENSLFIDDGIVKFRVDASVNNATYPNVDRLWLKFYVYATDEGEITLDYPIISPVDGIGRGSVVPLT